ncbi:dUTP diphosphatase [uncultured Clostridium sp.]|uniref:dUTP diphosphatase n=1 Tax=uncultured Clostridium sp. TaxID=59620 RepID=UPI00260F3E7F|nr:dUTP diphosphatase [uncultured Clostridium sp.]
MIIDGEHISLPLKHIKHRGFEVVRNEFRKFPDVEIKLPTRADVGSAGYDFYSPCDFTISPGQTRIIPMDVKVYMEQDEVLMLYIRSSIGIKKQVVLTNGTGVVDSTYYNNPDNDGNMHVALTNYSNNTWEFKVGERLMQGVFMKYFITDDDQPLAQTRIGGIGSSGK